LIEKNGNGRIKGAGNRFNTKDVENPSLLAVEPY